MRTERRRQREGGVSAIEFALTTPVLLLFVMLAVQFALIAHAQNGAQSAAEEGAAAARTVEGTSADGEERAASYLSELGRSMFSSTSVSASRTAEQATVTVTGSVVRLVPLVPLEISRTSSGPVERFVEEVP